MRRLAVKCANSHVITARNNKLKPIQVEVGVSGGAEAAVHSVRRLVESFEDVNVLVKLDFANLTDNLPLPVREIIFDGRLIALQKKDGGIRSTATGYTLRRLAPSVPTTTS